jgi:hypothetical protein
MMAVGENTAAYIIASAMGKPGAKLLPKIESAVKKLRWTVSDKRGSTNFFGFLGSKATHSNYRVNFWNAYHGSKNRLPNHEVHHSIPQKYEKMFSDIGINIHENKYLSP